MGNPDVDDVDYVIVDDDVVDDVVDDEVDDVVDDEVDDVVEMDLTLHYHRKLIRISSIWGLRIF